MYAEKSPNVEQEILLKLPFNYGFYRNGVLLAYIRAIPDNGYYISHWAAPFEGSNYPSIFLRDFMLWKNLNDGPIRIWTYVSRKNTTCLTLLHRIADRLPLQYVKSFTDLKNGLILVELKSQVCLN